MSDFCRFLRSFEQLPNPNRIRTRAVTVVKSLEAKPCHKGLDCSNCLFGEREEDRRIDYINRNIGPTIVGTLISAVVEILT